MNYARRLDRRAALRKRSRLVVKDQIRRGLMAERLEERSLLAGDLLSPFTASFHSDFWNINKPTDVNADGLVAPNDALAVINSLNAHGSYKLSAGAAGEGESSSKMYVDVNNDGYLSPIDALAVINKLNGEGETTKTAQFQILTLAPGTDDPLTTIQAGQEFDVQILVQDLRSAGDPNRGVFAGYTDLLYDKSLSQVEVGEVQRVTFGNPTTGTFTLSVNGQTTAPFSISGSQTNNTNRVAMAASVQTALNNLLGANSVSVSLIGSAGFDFSVWFSGKMNINFPKMTAALVTGTGTATVQDATNNVDGAAFQAVDGDPSIPASFTEAFRSRDLPNGDTASAYQNGASAADAADRVDDVGFFAGTTALGTFPLELARVRMKATLPAGVDSAALTFTPDFTDIVHPAHDTLLYANVAVDPPEKVTVAIDEINVIQATLAINSGVITAVADTLSVNEDAPAGPATTVNVLANDSKTAGAPAGALQVVSFTQPASGGTVARQVSGDLTNGNLVFTPAANFAGTATFTYTVGVVGDNNVLDQKTQTVTVTVNPVNDAPTLATIANQSIDEDAATTVNLTGIGAGGGADEATQTLTVTAVSSNPTLIANPVAVNYTPGATTGSLSFTPALNQSGTATIVVTVQDNGGVANSGADTVTQTFTVTVNAVNDAPANNLNGTPISGATPDQITTPGTPLEFNNGNVITVTDVDAAASPLAVTLALGAGQGTLSVATATGVTITGNGSASVSLNGPQAALTTALAGLVYTPADGFTGTATLTITSNDGGATGSGGPQTTVSTVTIKLDPGVRPFAVNDKVSIPEANTATPPVTTIDVLFNDFKSATTTTTILSVNQPPTGQGSVVVNNGKLDYTQPAGDFFTPNAPVQFTYTITDGVGADSTGTVSVTITNVPDAPVAVNDAYQTAIGVALTRTAAQGVLANDTNVDNNFGKADVATQTVLAGSVTQPAHGSVTVNSDGSFTYTPAAGFGGDDSFTYKAHSSLGPDSASATVSIHVAAPPVATADSFTTAQEDQAFTSPTSVLANDTDPTEHQTLTAVLNTNVPASAGSVTLNADGTFTYNPAANFNTTRPLTAPITFTYHASAGGRDSAPVTVSITVNEVNDNPTAANDTFTAVKNNGTVGIDQPISVLGNDSFLPDAPETLTVISVGATAQSANGSSVKVSGGQILYTSPTVTGNDSFTYTISDGRGGTATATVNVTVVDFVPKSVSGTVYLDGNNNGVIDAGEKRLAGVEVHLNGTSFLNDTIALTAFTDANGNYTFAGLKPPVAGTRYTLTEIQPAYLLSGIDSNGGVGASAALVTNTSATDNLFTMGWVITDSSGNVNGLNFGERGINMASLSDSSGFLAEFLASSGSNGFVIAAGLTGNALWSYSLPGWENAKSITATLSSNLSSLTISGVDGQGNAFSTILHTTYPTTADGFPAGSTARFRILGTGQNGQYIIRIDGTAADCGLNLLAAAPGGSGAEGESSGSQQYADSADAVFAEAAWA